MQHFEKQVSRYGINNDVETDKFAKNHWNYPATLHKFDWKQIE